MTPIEKALLTKLIRNRAAELQLEISEDRLREVAFSLQDAMDRQLRGDGPRDFQAEWKRMMEDVVERRRTAGKPI